MITAKRVCVLLLAALWTGCASYQSLHYNWAYTPLHDVTSGGFQASKGDPEYRRLDSYAAMAAAERDMYRNGYVMIGYSNMISPQLQSFGDSGAQALADKYGASVVLNYFSPPYYLATLWARPRQFVFGAYFTDQLPEEARKALELAQKTEHAVIIQTVVPDSPAFAAGIRPGDLVFRLNGEAVTDSAAMSALLQHNVGHDVELGVWSMEEGPPRSVTVALEQ
ncbi:MAG: PDZ domain-containing protein [Pseudomonadota bacterium]